MYTCNEVPDNNLIIFERTDNTTTLSGNGNCLSTMTRFPFLEQSSALQVVDHNEVRSWVVHLLQNTIS